MLSATGKNLIIVLFVSLNWQHLLCKDPLPVPDIKTLLVDHVCKLSLNLSLQSEGSDSIENTVSDRHLSNRNSVPSTITDSEPFPAALTNPGTSFILAFFFL